MDKIFSCPDDDIKEFKIRFDSGSLKRDDTWLLCKKCERKAKFKNYRVKVESLEAFTN